MDVDWALQQQQQQQQQAPAWAGWHDCVNAVVRNNVVEGGAGAAVAFYSVRDAVVVHNTLLGAAATMQVGNQLTVLRAGCCGRTRRGCGFRSRCLRLPCRVTLQRLA